MPIPNWKRRAKYNERRRNLVRKLGGKCVDCGSIENLEFDHIDPDTKVMKTGNLLQLKLNDTIFEIEIKKLQLLCKPCHDSKSGKEKEREVCMRGHPRTPENVLSNGTCRTCHRNYGVKF